MKVDGTKRWQEEGETLNRKRDLSFARSQVKTYSSGVGIVLAQA